jgi:NADH:ubiquinone oxidoreductase subunit H
MIINQNLVFRLLVLPSFVLVFRLFKWVEKKLESGLQNRVYSKSISLGETLSHLDDFMKLLTKKVNVTSCIGELFTIDFGYIM